MIWFASYLTDRTQTTQVETSISSKGKILFGVPQGSVLGPLLFLIYINDIYRVSSKLNFYLFADDTNILYANNNLKSLESVVNEELRTQVRLFPDRGENVSGIGVLNKKASLFCLLNQFVLQTLFMKQETWYFLLDKQKRAPFSISKQINCAY